MSSTWLLQSSWFPILSSDFCVYKKLVQVSRWHFTSLVSSYKTDSGSGLRQPGVVPSESSSWHAGPFKLINLFASHWAEQSKRPASLTVRVNSLLKEKKNQTWQEDLGFIHFAKMQSKSLLLKNFAIFFLFHFDKKAIFAPPASSAFV